MSLPRAKRVDKLRLSRPEFCRTKLRFFAYPALAGVRSVHAIGAAQRPKPQTAVTDLGLLCNHHPEQWRCIGPNSRPFSTRCAVSLYVPLLAVCSRLLPQLLGPVQDIVRKPLEREPAQVAPQGESRTGAGGRPIPEPVNPQRAACGCPNVTD